MDVSALRVPAVAAVLAVLAATFAPGSPASADSGDARLPVVSPTPRSMTELGGPVRVPDAVRLVVGAHTDASALRTLTGVLHDAGVHDVSQGPQASDEALDIWVGGPAEGNAGADGVLHGLGVRGPGGLPADGYVLAAGRNDGRPVVVLSGVDAAGTFYAVQTFRQLLEERGTDTYVAGVRVRDWPSFPLRGGMESFYGEPWAQADALHHVDFLAAHKMNALLYTPSGDPRTAGSLTSSPGSPS